MHERLRIEKYGGKETTVGFGGVWLNQTVVVELCSFWRKHFRYQIKYLEQSSVPTSVHFILL